MTHLALHRFLSNQMLSNENVAPTLIKYIHYKTWYAAGKILTHAGFLLKCFCFSSLSKIIFKMLYLP